MGSTKQELTIMQEYSDWHSKDPKMPSERKREAEKQAQSDAMARFRATRALKKEREAAIAAPAPAAASAATSTAAVSVGMPERASTPDRHSTPETRPPSPQTRKRKASPAPATKPKWASTFGDIEDEGEDEFTYQPNHGTASSGTSSVSPQLDVFSTSASNFSSDTSGSVSPPKKFKLGPKNIPSTLTNGQQACYQNAALQMLASIPAFATMGNAQPHKGAEEGIAAPFSALMHYMRNDKRLDTTLFQKRCGLVLGTQYDGSTQEDAHEFLLLLVQQLQKERSDLLLSAQFSATFVRKSICLTCKRGKEFTEGEDSICVELPFNDPEPEHLHSLVKDHMECGTDFQKRECDACRDVGMFDMSRGKSPKRIRVAPAYLRVVIPRDDPKGGSAKNRTKVDFGGQLRLKTEGINGVWVEYDLIAAVGHDGRTPHHGHFVSLRKVGGKWYHCDDAELNGVKVAQAPRFASKNTHVSMCLYKRVD